MSMVIRSIEDEAKNEENKNVVTGKVVRNMSIARKLLSHVDWKPSNEIRVIDIKKNKEDPTGNSTVIIFENNEAFQKLFSEVIEENRRDRGSRETDELKRQIEELTKKVAELSNTKED